MLILIPNLSNTDLVKYFLFKFEELRMSLILNYLTNLTLKFQTLLSTDPSSQSFSHKGLRDLVGCNANATSSKTFKIKLSDKYFS